MREEFVYKLADILSPLMENVYIYFFWSVIVYFIGGIDESIITLACLNLIDILVGLLSNARSKNNIIINKLKIYLVIMLGVMLDRLLGIDTNIITRARTYIILAYSYNEIVSIVNTLCADDNFYLPKGIRSYAEKLRKKEEEFENE